MSAPSSAQPGQSFVLSASIKNQGNASASSVQVAFYLTTSALNTTEATLLGTQNVGSLSAGATLAITTTLSIPSSTSSGTFYVAAIADPSTAIKESNEINNTSASGAIAVTDLTPLTISTVTTSSITASSVTVTWTTNEASTSQVEYGITATYGSSTSLDSSLVASHGVAVSGLTAGTVYHFRVRSKDAAGNEALSSNYSFTTSNNATVGNTYYVATTGSDNSSCGASTAPCATINYAYANKVAAGDTILVQPGRYSTGGRTGWGLVLLNKSGTAGAPITIQSVVRGGAILDSQSNTNYPSGLYVDGKDFPGGGSYNIVDGFKITGNTRCGVVMYGTTNNQFINNEIYGNGTAFQINGDCGAGIYEDETSSGNYFGSNYIHNNPSHALYLCGANDTVLNNIIANQGEYGLQLAGYTTVSNMKVYNNTFVSNGSSGIVIWMAMNGVDIKNNLFYQNYHAAIQIYQASGSGVTIDTNISYGNPNGDIWTDGSSLDYMSTHWNSNDPQFANAVAGDFRLQAGSPAIDVGITLDAVTTDFDGNDRPQGSAIDLGAFEFIPY